LSEQAQQWQNLLIDKSKWGGGRIKFIYKIKGEFIYEKNY
jgi:hypothetical protein